MIRLVELFSGIGAQRAALRNIGADFESVAVSEIDANAVKAYEAIYGHTENLGDIRQVKALPECDLLTYSFPCQDLSVAGTRMGMEEGSGTRSSLLWEVGRLLDVAKTEEMLPAILVMENVPAIHNNVNYSAFQSWIARLRALGYASSWADLRATDFGVPQNRVRTFMVSRLDGRLFEYPKGNPSECPPLRSVLEDDVPESYDVRKPIKKLYLDAHESREGSRRVIELDCSYSNRAQVYDPDASPTVVANCYKDISNAPKILTMDELPVPRPSDSARCRLALELDSAYAYRGRVYDSDGTSPAVPAFAGTGGGNAPKILAVGVPMKDRGRGDSMPARDGDGIVTSAFRKDCYSPVSPQTAPTLNQAQGCDASTVQMLPDGYRIRQLTERECWRLMGQRDEDFDKVRKAGVKKAHLYRLAGNSIVVPVLEAIFKALYCDKTPYQATLEAVD